MIKSEIGAGMKIGFISTIRGVSWGGSEELWAECALAALAENHRLIASMYSQPEIAPKVKNLQERGLKLFFHRPYAFRFWTRFYQQGRRKILKQEPFFPVESNSPFRFFFNERPDVICINQGDPYSFLMLPDLIEYLSITGIPYIVVSQGAFGYQVLSYEERTQMRSFFQQAYRTVFVAGANQKLVERQIARRIDNGFVLNNPANIDGYGILPYPETDVFKMGCVARLEVFHKAHDLLFEALSADAWRERNWQLNMYGKGGDEEYLKDLAAFYEIQDKVKFAGQISDVRNVWAENHLAVLTSYSEGFPLSIIEAMLCGRTAVVTNVGGLTELVTDSQNGFKAHCTSTSAIREALEKAWNNRHQLKEMGEKAYHEATAAYDLKPGTTLLELLKEAVGLRK